MSKHVSEDKQVIAGLLAIFLGGFGIHKFYVGRTKMGLIYLLFCWTFIPGLLGLIDGILILTKGRELL